MLEIFSSFCTIFHHCTPYIFVGKINFKEFNQALPSSSHKISNFTLSIRQCSIFIKITKTKNKYSYCSIPLENLYMCLYFSYFFNDKNSK